MIPRYKVQEIHDIWKTENKLNTWLKVEMAHLESLLGNIVDKTITEEEYDIVKKNIKINVDRWKEIEQETRHDVQAFVQMLEESIPDNSGRWIHFGLTSSDILDTSLVLMCKESLKHVASCCANSIYHLNKVLKSDLAYKEILGRTHGKAAEVQTYRDIILRWTDYLRRGYDEVVRVEKSLKWGKLSGAIGNNTFNSTQNEYNALQTLGLYPIRSSQVISRDVFLDYFYALLRVVLAVEKIAYDIRIYSIDGINEMAEPFAKGQKGSSAMPHKKNPILSENICGLTRLYKSYFHTAIENCTTLLERDISHSSSERIIFKDGAHITCFVLNRLTTIFKGLILLTETAQNNCKSFSSKISSQENMNVLIKKGDSRKNSHDLAQSKSV
jgi:adenylosuccinate lyase